MAQSGQPYLFPHSFLSAGLARQLPNGYAIRPLSLEDFDHGFLKCLGQLSVVGSITKEKFAERFKEMKTRGSYFIVVITEAVENSEDKAQSYRIVGAGTLFAELKFLRELGTVGHIEDIVVLDDMRGKKFGLRIIEQLKHIAESQSCYKVILNCSKENAPFYEKCGLQIKDHQMSQYFKGCDKKQ